MNPVFYCGNPRRFMPARAVVPTRYSDPSSSAEFSAGFIEVSGLIEHSFPDLEIGFRLAEHGNIQERENIAQVLLGHGSAGSPRRDAKDACRFSAHTLWPAGRDP